MRFTNEEVTQAMEAVRAVMPPTPQYAWPLLKERLGMTVWVKHENHTPLGAFKVRGGITYMQRLVDEQPGLKGVVAVTRGNHGHSVVASARRHGLEAVVVVPKGNSLEKNAATRALGGTLIEHGDDFLAARAHAQALAEERKLHMVPMFHPELVRGVSTCWVEFFTAMASGGAPDVVFVPIGQGSCFAGAAAARHFTGATTRLVGVVSSQAPSFLESFRAGQVVPAPVTTQLADGISNPVAGAEALEVVLREADDIVAVSDAEVAEAMRALFADTHNVAEGAGAAALAGAMQQRGRYAGRSVGVALTGGNVDTAVFTKVLAGA